MLLLRILILLGVSLSSICAIVVQSEMKTLSLGTAKSVPVLAFKPQRFKIKRSTVESSHRIPLPDVISALASIKQPMIKISPSPISRFKSSKSGVPHNPISSRNNEVSNSPNYRLEPFTPRLTTMSSGTVSKMHNSHGPSAFMNISAGPYAVHQRPYRQLFGFNSFETSNFDDFSDPYKKFFGSSVGFPTKSKSTVFKPSWPEFKKSQPPEVFGAQPPQQSASHFQPSRTFYNGKFMNQRYSPSGDVEFSGKKVSTPLAQLHSTSEFLEPPPAFVTTPIIVSSEAGIDYRTKPSIGYGFPKPTNVKLGNIPPLTGSSHHSGKGTTQQPRRLIPKNTILPSYTKAPNDYQELKNQPQLHFNNNVAPAVIHNKVPVFHYTKPSSEIRTDVEVVENKRPKPPPPVSDEDSNEDSNEDDRDDDEGYKNTERDYDDFSDRPNPESRKKPYKDTDDDEDFSFREFEKYGKYPKDSSAKGERPTRKRTHYTPRYEEEEEEEEDFTDDEKSYPRYKPSSFGYDGEIDKRHESRRKEGSSNNRDHRGRSSKPFKEFPSDFEDDFSENPPHLKKQPEISEVESLASSSYSSEESPRSVELKTNYDELEEPEDRESQGSLKYKAPLAPSTEHDGNQNPNTSYNEPSEEVNDDFFGDKIHRSEEQPRYAKNYGKRRSNAATVRKGHKESSTGKTRGPFDVKNTSKMNDAFPFLNDDEFPSFSEKKNKAHKKSQVQNDRINYPRNRSKLSNSKVAGKEIDYFANENLFDDIDI